MGKNKTKGSRGQVEIQEGELWTRRPAEGWALLKRERRGGGGVKAIKQRGEEGEQAGRIQKQDCWRGEPAEGGGSEAKERQEP